MEFELLEGIGIKEAMSEVISDLIVDREEVLRVS